MRTATAREFLRLLDPDRLEDAEQDVYAPSAGEYIACWACGRSPAQVWRGGVWRCAGSGACRRWYSSAGISPQTQLARQKCRCGWLLFRLRAASKSKWAASECTRCGRTEPLSSSLERIALLTSAMDRDMLRESGYLAPLPAAGPTGAGPRRAGPSKLLPRIRLAYMPSPAPPEPPEDPSEVRERRRERARSGAFAAWETRRRRYGSDASGISARKGWATRRAMRERCHP